MKISFSQCIFELIKSEPHLTDAEVHARMSLNPDYKIASGKSLLYRMVTVKYVHRDKNGRLTAVISNYAPLPPYKPRPKKKAKPKATQGYVPATGLVAAAKIAQHRAQELKEAQLRGIDPYRDQYQYRNSSDMAHKNVPIHIGIEPKKTFWRKLRELFSD